MDNDDKRQILSAMAMVGGIGLTMVATVVIGIFGGRLLDEWLGTSPWGAVSGIVLGMVSGLWATYKKAIGR